MKNNKQFDVIIIGGSYSGLAAGLALGRALKQVLIIDSGKPCNIQTPHSHNFITQDGKTPKEIATLARQQLEKYDTIHFFVGLAINGIKETNGFAIQTASGETFTGKKLIFATGIKDIMPDIKGHAECWGISVIHCPYCHGYEVRNEVTGILSNGDAGFELSTLISNWTKRLTLFTNGRSTLNIEQSAQLSKHNINIIEKEILEFEHDNGHLRNIVFKDGSLFSLKALYAHTPFEQHCSIPQSLGCEMTEEGYIKVDALQKTSVPGIYACGDNTTRMRAVALVVAMGTKAGVAASREIIFEEF
jgi:thioredoxin reductase